VPICELASASGQRRGRIGACSSARPSGAAQAGARHWLVEVSPLRGMPPYNPTKILSPHVASGPARIASQPSPRRLKAVCGGVFLLYRVLDFVTIGHTQLRICRRHLSSRVLLSRGSAGGCTRPSALRSPKDRPAAECAWVRPNDQPGKSRASTETGDDVEQDGCPSRARERGSCTIDGPRITRTQEAVCGLSYISSVPKPAQAMCSDGMAATWLPRCGGPGVPQSRTRALEATDFR